MRVNWASILEWGKSFDDIPVLQDQNTVQMDLSGDENSFPSGVQGYWG
jgi:hypothetical protein